MTRATLDRSRLFRGTAREEISSILSEDPSLGRLVERQPDEPEVAAIELLCTGPSPYFLVTIPVPGRRGSVWVSRLPGSRPIYTENEVLALVRFGIDRVVCLVPTDALENLHGAYRYLGAARALFPGRFHQLEIPDHDIPPDDRDFESVLGRIDQALRDGERVLAHCVGGCGRTGLFVACLLVLAGRDPIEAIRHFRRHRRCGPETPEQVAYVIRFGRRVGARKESGDLDATAVRVMSDSTGRPHLIARGGLGSVYFGRLHFDGGRSRRVAVKHFPRPLDRDEAARHERRISELRSAGVRLPRMLMARTADGTWVQVTPLFGSVRGGSKLWQPSQFYHFIDISQKRFAIEQLTRVANAGYSPSIDLFVVFRDAAKGIIPLDLDLVELEPSAEARGRKLLRCVVQLGSFAGERDQLYAEASAVASLPMRAALEECLNAPGSAYRALWRLE